MMNTNKSTRSILAFGILFLFFLQLITGFIQGIYAFGLLQTDIPAEIAAVLLLLSPFLLVISRKEWPRWLLLVIGEGLVVCRITAVLLDTQGQMLVSGLGSALFLLFFPLLLYENGRRRDRDSGLVISAGLALGLGLSITFRSLNSSLDVSTAGWTQTTGWLLALLLAWRLPKDLLPVRSAGDAGDGAENQAAAQGKTGRLAGLSLGITAVLSLLYFAFSSPTVITRWTEANYLLVVALAMVMLLILAWLQSFRGRFLSRLSRWSVFLVSSVFTLALAITLLSGQPAFPDSPTGYPLLGPEPGLLVQLAMLLTLVLMPVLLLNFGRFIDEIGAIRPSLRSLGLSFGLSSFFLLLMIFAHVFTTAYDYIPVVGPFFRDKYWLVYAAVGLALTVATLLIGTDEDGHQANKAGAGLPLLYPVAMLLLGITAVVGVLATSARPGEQASTNRVRILNYNLQQGYRADGQIGIDDQLALIKELNPDIIGLQETDTARIAGGNIDLARILADRLDMYSYYGPTPISGTFGDVLLSKYPIENPETYFLYSEGEQVAVVTAQVTTGGQTFTICVNHFGNSDDPAHPLQAEQFLELCGGRPNLIAPGDNNFSRQEPDPSIYLGISEVLDNTWQQSGRPWPEGKIEHIFISPNLVVCDVGYVDSPASDHPAEWAEICWED